MAKVYGSGFERGGTDTVLEFIGGIKDGMVFTWGEPPQEFRFPIMPNLSWSMELTDDVMSPPIQFCRYKRVGDTLNYICIDWYKI